MPVIDVSVYISLINEGEEQYASSWTWFENAQAGQEQLVAPVILLAEVAAALNRGVGDKALAHRVVDQLKGSEIIEWVPVTSALAEQAAAIAADHRIRGCDAIYVAVASRLGDSLVTLDRQQLERAAAVVTVHRP